jgi:hypothetical protein
MEKIYGATAAQDGLYKIGRSKYELIYGYGKDSDEQEFGWNYRQRFTYQPSLDEIKKIITTTIEDEYAKKLRYGLVWNGLPVEYTEERKSDLTGLLVALQGGLLELPITLNLGADENGSSVFHSFESAEEISSVAVAICNHKINTTAEEWATKESVNWAVFEELQ